MRFRFWTFIFGMVLCALMLLCGCGGGGEESSATTSKTWHHPASLADSISPAGQDESSPQVAMDDSGNAIIVWSQFDGNGYQIYKSEYRNGLWMHPVDLLDNISPDVLDNERPQVAMDDNGNAVIVWCQYGGNYTKIFKSEYRDGVWVHPSSSEDYISYGGNFPKVAMDNNGNTIVVWVAGSYGDMQIFKSEYRNGVWSHPADKINPDGKSVGDPHVAMDNNGNAIIVWRQTDANGREQIFKSEYRSGTWTHPSSLADHISFVGSGAWELQVAMDDNGNAIVIWTQDDGASQPLFKSEYRNGVWTKPSGITDKINPTGDPHCLEVKMDNSGNAIIVWEQYDGDNQQIYKSEYRGGVWTHPASLTDSISPGGSNASSPHVAMDNNGNALIVWDQENGVICKIFKSEYRNGAWMYPSTLSNNINPDGVAANLSQVAANKLGNAIIVGHQTDGSNWQIFKSEYR